MRAQQYLEHDGCESEGPFSGWQLVVPPDERIKPVVEAPLIDGDQIIRVMNQIVGSELTVLIRDGAAEPEVRFGPRPASEEPEIALNAPLQTGQQLAVEQHLCGRIEVSDWLSVLPAPTVVLAPIILPPVYACGGAVQVSGLHPGALVRVYQDDIPCGIAWAGLANSVTIAAAPALVEDAVLTARQWVGGSAGPLSQAVRVELAGDAAHEPRIVEPVALSDTEVVVSGVSPGSLVSIYSGRKLVGERYAGESLVRVGVDPVASVIRPVARLCDYAVSGDRVSPISGPHATGPYPGTGEQDIDFGDYLIPVHLTPDGSEDGGFESPVRGRLYFPADSNGEIPESAKNLPLVVISHGLWYSDIEDQSHLGYAWLAHHLARWGILVLSIDLSVVNWHTAGGPKQQTARAELMLEAVERAVLALPLRGRVNQHRIGLVGHSMSGEGVLVAKVLSSARPLITVQGIVSIAPVNYRTDLYLEDCHYLQLHGSFDYLLGGWLHRSGFRGHHLYDRAWRHRTLAWVEGARHQGWNPNWWNSPFGAGEGQSPIVGTLLPEDHAAVGRALINAFFQDTLCSRPEYRPYLEGLIESRAVRPYAVHMQHHGTEAYIVDDMGDADRALGLVTESPIDPTQNRQGAVVSAIGPPSAIDVWQDVAQSQFPRSSQTTLVSDLAWSARDISYRSETPGLSASRSDEVVLRIALAYETAPDGVPIETWNTIGLDLDLFVELESPSGNAMLRLGSSALIPYPAPGFGGALAVPRTIRLPIDAFTAMNSSFDPNSITAIVLRPAGGATGRILIDDIEVAP